ncbi:hypothetical protein LFT51_14680 [Mycobacterium intracellulare subsp. chimaera]|uniref:hypothetical protein n=1 Tax=Mycobacterium intracellulare TaxID=1767 RepID=UPI0005B43371|nr:hypothetical protein [Mycobacterium intracellulare]AOS92268.1 hypothetical protein AN480_13830 [Mycobacterium intracellulare subsp. chimaera]KPN49191.1 hypothetical protein AN933_22340 [Mycobacterium intracellulare subsp. chimaera]KPN51379.1 hypothetical protein AN932_10500 [Mycobacterium intracellulare subsp. chimaera]KPN57242.1 hypothetical protein AN931_11235 [Mycobacterium intracellulare subsp. chimaera]ORV23534.1 hypothetical protein AWB97_22910 [Mycobacterium intracellulare subsp. chi
MPAKPRATRPVRVLPKALVPVPATRPVRVLPKALVPVPATRPVLARPRGPGRAPVSRLDRRWQRPSTWPTPRQSNPRRPVAPQ